MRESVSDDRLRDRRGPRIGYGRVAGPGVSRLSRRCPACRCHEIVTPPARIPVDNGDMSRRLRVIVASGLLAAAILGAAAVATQIATTYYLPSSTGNATEHTALFGPAIAATVVAVLAVAALVAHLVAAIQRRPRRWMWAVASGLTLVAVASPFVVGSLDRPTF